MQGEYRSYSKTPPAMNQRFSSLSISSKDTDNSDYVSRFSHEPYKDLLYRSGVQRRRLSSTGDGSGDSSTTTSGSSYGESGEREDGSEGRAESDETDREEQEDRKPLEGQITYIERQKVEAFFKGLKTQVFVSESLANLYYKKATDQDWCLKCTGIPVVILDVGESRARDKRRIQIALAERGTSFMLWRDIIDNLSSYKVAGSAFHTMCLSEDHTTQVGFSFDTAQAAHDMWTHIESLVSCPENISLSMPGKKKKKRDKKPPKPVPLPPKSHISTPCFFNHITSVDIVDVGRFHSLKEYLPPRIQNTRIHELKEM